LRAGIGQKRLDQALDVRIAILALLGERPQHDPSELARQVWAQLGRGFWLTVGDRQHQPVVALGGEG